MTDDKLEAEYRGLLHDFERTFSTDYGMRVLFYLLDRGLYHRTAFTGNSQTYWRCGVQDYVREVIADNVQAANKDVYLKVLSDLIEKYRVPYKQKDKKYA